MGFQFQFQLSESSIYFIIQSSACLIRCSFIQASDLELKTRSSSSPPPPSSSSSSSSSPSSSPSYKIILSDENHP